MKYEKIVSNAKNNRKVNENKIIKSNRNSNSNTKTNVNINRKDNDNYSYSGVK